MNRFKQGVVAGAALAALALIGGRSMADEIVPNGGWDVFEFGGVGTPVFDSLGNIDFTFTLASANTLRITDGYFDGDQFDVIINGVDQGATSTPTVATMDVDDNWTSAFYQYGANYSHASYKLGPGVYDVEAYMVQSPFGAGAGAFSIGAIPEPTAWAMMLVGFAGLGALARRRQRLANA